MNLTLAAIVIMGGWVVVIVAAGLVMSLRPGGVAVRLAPVGGPASALTGRREEILLGGEAEALGNVRGRVRAVLFGSENHQLQAVALTGGLDEQDVPASAILSADGRVLSLRDGWADVAQIEGDSKAASLRENATVVSAEGKQLGKLRLVCFEPVSGVVTTLVVEGRETPRQRLVPLSRVKEAGPHRIVTDLTSAEWTNLSAFATDSEIRQTILDHLAADPDLQALPRSLRIDVQGQRVKLNGYVTNRGQADRLSQLVRSIPGALQPSIDVITDEDLARAVREALGGDPATTAARVQIDAHYGTVEITGEAPDRSTMRNIDAVARQVPGVQVVHNMAGVPTPGAPAS